jgi:hypothetical protein
MHRRRLSRPRETGVRRMEASISPGRITARWATADRDLTEAYLDLDEEDFGTALRCAVGGWMTRWKPPASHVAPT